MSPWCNDAIKKVPFTQLTETNLGSIILVLELLVSTYVVGGRPAGRRFVAMHQRLAQQPVDILPFKANEIFRDYQTKF
jgi:hypothetical protein